MWSGHAACIIIDAGNFGCSPDFALVVSAYGVGVVVVVSFFDACFVDVGAVACALAADLWSTDEVEAQPTSPVNASEDSSIKYIIAITSTTHRAIVIPSSYPGVDAKVTVSISFFIIHRRASGKKLLISDRMVLVNVQPGALFQTREMAFVKREVLILIRLFVMRKIQKNLKKGLRVVISWDRIYGK